MKGEYINNESLQKGSAAKVLVYILLHNVRWHRIALSPNLNMFMFTFCARWLPRDNFLMNWSLWKLCDEMSLELSVFKLSILLGGKLQENF